MSLANMHNTAVCQKHGQRKCQLLFAWWFGLAAWSLEVVSRLPQEPGVQIPRIQTPWEKPIDRAQAHPPRSRCRKVFWRSLRGKQNLCLPHFTSQASSTQTLTHPAPFRRFWRVPFLGWLEGKPRLVGSPYFRHIPT